MRAKADSAPRHLEDGHLLGYMDHALDHAAQRRVEGHLAYCEACRARLAGLRSAAAEVGGWLTALDAAPSEERRVLAMAAVERARFRRRAAHPWNRRGTLAAAAMVALLLTVAFGTPPGRAWVGDAAARLGLGAGPGARAEDAAAVPDAPVAAAAPEGAAAPAAPPATVRAPGAGAGGPAPGTSHPVHFEPAGNYVRVRFASRQQVGTAAIWVRDEPGATARIVSGRSGETLTPTGDGVLIRNRPTSGADYIIVVPTRYRFLRVQIGDEPETRITITRSSLDWLWTMNLAVAEEETGVSSPSAP